MNDSIALIVTIGVPFLLIILIISLFRKFKIVRFFFFWIVFLLIFTVIILFLNFILPKFPTWVHVLFPIFLSVVHEYFVLSLFNFYEENVNPQKNANFLQLDNASKNIIFIFVWIGYAFLAFTLYQSHQERAALKEQKRIENAEKFKAKYGIYSRSKDFECLDKYYCEEMDSCEEAEFYYDECLLYRLDGDSDGIPCETLCY